MWFFFTSLNQPILSSSGAPFLKYPQLRSSRARKTRKGCKQFVLSYTHNNFLLSTPIIHEDTEKKNGSSTAKTDPRRPLKRLLDPYMDRTSDSDSCEVVMMVIIKGICTENIIFYVLIKFSDVML